MVFIDFSENEEVQDFKKPYKSCCFLMIFDFTKQKSLKYIGFYRLFENLEISNVKKNVIKPDDLSTFQFWYVERSRGGAV